MTINILDRATISKIAAGEIIENPASIVKELLENSIDAKASNILIDIKGSPCDYIKISDDGVGMTKDDLKIAFLRHSTSKLKSIEDLANIYSLGFRGEALASISSISKVEVLTKHKDEKSGLKAEVIEGKISEISNLAMQEGTTFYIRDVFYNTPVRKKYLKNDNTEFNNIYDIVSKIALSNPHISIRLRRDGKIILNSIAHENELNHIYSILRRDIASKLIKLDFSSSSYKIKAYISNNELFRSNRSHQYIFINNRYVKSNEISKAIEDVYYSLIPLNRYPVFVLYVEIDPILIDVNIHPKKQEVKFSEINNLTEILRNLVKDALIPKRVVSNKTPKKEEEKVDNLNIFDIFNKVQKYSSDDSASTFAENKNLDYQFLDMAAEDQDSYSDTKEEIILEDNNTNNITKEIDEEEIKEDQGKKIDINLLKCDFVGILFNTFIILEDKSSDSFFLIDQHAAHERIMYEKYKKQYENSNIYSQLLLTPEIIHLNPKEKDLVNTNSELLKKLGFDFDDFGDNEIVIRQTPMLFGSNISKNFIYEIIDSLEDVRNSVYEVDPYKIMKKACKSAVKAGDKLSYKEVETLIQSLISCDNPYTCPHGRPTVIELNKYAIEKVFLR